MPTYYVRITGDDSTGDGSDAKPWRTVSKALSSISGGDIVNVGDGIYQENTAASGYLQLKNVYSSLVIIQAEKGTAGNVIVQGTSGPTYNVRNTANISNMLWKNIHFTARPGSTIAFAMNADFAATNMQFQGCSFDADNAAGTYGVLSEGGASTMDYTFTGCLFTHVNAGAGNAMRAVLSQARITLNLIDCTCTSASNGIRADGLHIVLNITGGNYSSSGVAVIAILFGSDDFPGTGLGVTGFVKGATITSVQSHALLIGDSATGVVASGNTIVGGDYGAAFKNANNCIITGNTITGGTKAALFPKGGNLNQITGNTVTVSQGVGIINHDVANYVVSNTIITGNAITCSGNAVAYDWISATDGGGNVLDYQTFRLFGSSIIGTVRASSGITTIPTLIAAWAGYTPPGNDTHSTLQPRTYYVRTTGSDTNDGSQSAPWKTVDKALTSCASGDIILISDGIYKESSGGAGYLKVAQAFGSLVTVRAESGAAGNVFVQGAADATYNVRQTGAINNLLFKFIKFTGRQGSLYAWAPATGFNTANLFFEDCEFNAPDAPGTYAVVNDSSSATTTQVWTYTRCKFTHPNAGVGNTLTCITGTAQTSVITLVDCISISAAAGVWIDGYHLTVNIIGGNFSNTGASQVSLLIGADGAVGSGKGVTGSVTGATVTSANFHALEIGDNSHGIVATGNTVSGADYSIVLKNATDAIVQYNTVTGGSKGLIFPNGGNQNTIQYNTLTVAQGFGIVNHDPGNYTVQNTKILGNRIILKGAAQGIDWISATDGGGNVVDYNVYDMRGTGNLGNVLSATNLSTLAALTMAWAGYGTPGNESHTQLAATQTLIQNRYTATGSWLYAIIANVQGRVWNGSAFEEMANANMAQYALPLVEDPAGSYRYSAVFPLLIPSGQYTVWVFPRTGDLPAPADARQDTQTVPWNGVAQIFQSGDSFARIGPPAGATLSADIAAVAAEVQHPNPGP
jgi:hypothetical protein